MLFLKRNLHSITECEIGSETTASTSNEKRKNFDPTPTAHIYSSCNTNRRETFNEEEEEEGNKKLY